ncbi:MULTISPECIES: response regulator transcription factor [unclassified Nitratiruptor]|uniref:response regulator transcription factor n=1 Tax=unclassified Nitratiruptor TaxID=2624044 RepID=UPI0019155E42|nr:MULTISPECIES: response regulator transcription factor [unclassified Nitratiruptor]BCD60733.1 two-component system, OmpR family, response regulator [Nitratiruptor sp. YY08-10]BCD64665.1 two-component system, OmpR family, response regulator [Nitratiruptor sp. YY08-14]
MSNKILLVEDDRLFSETLQEFLEEEGFAVDVARTMQDAIELHYANRYDLLLLDVMLPDGDGFTLLKELRSIEDMTPAIFITSKKQKNDIKEGFLLGGDDYLTKPIDLEELLWRIGAILRRVHHDAVIEIDGYYFYPEQFVLKKGNEIIDLKQKELQLLHLFLKNRKKVVTKEQIFQTLWSHEEIISEGSLRVYISTLKKIFGKDSIQNIRSIGYRFEK